MYLMCFELKNKLRNNFKERPQNFNLRIDLRNGQIKACIV